MLIRRDTFLALGFVLLPACAAPSAEPPTAAEADYTASPYAANMRAACLAALPGVPETRAGALDDGQLAELGSRPELARGFLDVYRVSCSTKGYGPYETPTCARVEFYERVDTNYSPRHEIDRHESYRDVVARVASGHLVLETAAPRYDTFRPSFTVDGSPDALHVLAEPPRGRAFPDDLQQVGSYSRVELSGALTNGSLVLAHTVDPVVTWNVVQCTRAVLRMDFTPATKAAE